MVVGGGGAATLPPSHPPAHPPLLPTHPRAKLGALELAAMSLKSTGSYLARTLSCERAWGGRVGKEEDCVAACRGAAPLPRSHAHSPTCANLVLHPLLTHYSPARRWRRVCAGARGGGACVQNHVSALLLRMHACMHELLLRPLPPHALGTPPATAPRPLLTTTPHARTPSRAHTRRAGTTAARCSGRCFGSWSARARPSARSWCEGVCGPKMMLMARCPPSTHPQTRSLLAHRASSGRHTSASSK